MKKASAGKRPVHPKAVWPGSTQLAPVPAVMISCGGFDRWPVPNILTVAWTGILCSDPPMLSISVRRARYSWEILSETKEFAVNVPSAALAEDTDWCGVVSGRDHDKFRERGLTPVPGAKIRCPLIGEAPLALECRIVSSQELGSHTLFLAEILAVRPDETLMDEKGAFHPEKAGLVAYLHGNYHLVGRKIGHFGYSVRKKKGPVIR